MEDWKAKEAARRVAASALRAANPGLVACGENESSLTAAAKNIRIELKAAFPGVKFSVKSRRFSGGDAIDVSWIDGPNTEQVDPIIDKYSAGSFDGMTDCYNYERSTWTDAFGDAKYVHSRREFSDKAVASAIRTVVSKYGAEAAVTVEQYRKGEAWRKQLPSMGYETVADLVNKTLYRRTWALAKQVKATSESEVV